MNNFLVTGCAGFIGSHMVDILMENNHNVVGVDKFTYASNTDNFKHHLKNGYMVSDTFKMYPFDICDHKDIEHIFNHNDIDCIINFAAETHVDNSIKGSHEFITSNVQGVKTLLDVARNHNLPFCQISTDEVYGSILEGSFSEDSKLNPQNYYSATKAAAEHLVKASNNTFGLEYLMVRMSNNYGPRQHTEKFLPTIINSIKNNKKIPLYGNGENVRDWLFVKDSVRIIYNLIINAPRNETYNVTLNDERKNIDVIKTVLENFDLDFNDSVEFVEDRLGHDFRYSINNNKIQDFIDFKPTSFEEGVKQTIAFVQEQK